MKSVQSSGYNCIVTPTVCSHVLCALGFASDTFDKSLLLSCLVLILGYLTIGISSITLLLDKAIS